MYCCLTALLSFELAEVAIFPDPGTYRERTKQDGLLCWNHFVSINIPVYATTQLTECNVQRRVINLKKTNKP